MKAKPLYEVKIVWLRRTITLLLFLGFIIPPVIVLGVIVGALSGIAEACSVLLDSFLLCWNGFNDKYFGGIK